MHLITFFKAYKMLKWYYEDIDLFNGITTEKYNFKQLTPGKFHVRIVKIPGKLGKYTEFKNLNIKVSIDKDTLLYILNKFIIEDKKDAIELLKKLSNTEIKLFDRFTENYSKFYSEIPIVIV